MTSPSSATEKLPSAWELESRLLDAIETFESVQDGELIPEEIAELVAVCVKTAAEKRDALAGAYKLREAHVAALEARAKDAAEKAARAEKALRRFDAYLLSLLDMAGSKSLPGIQYSIKARQNPPHVEVDEPKFWAGELATELCRRIPARLEPDKRLIKTALERGEEVQGATMVPGAWRIEIK